jgi:hypothetical protein
MIACAALLLATALLGALPQDQKQHDPEAEPIISFDDPNVSELAIIDVHMDALARRARFYRYDLKHVPWDYDVIHCPLIKKHLLLKGKSLDEMHPSDFIAIIPHTSGDTKIVPLWQNSLRTFGAPYRDSHNWAYFGEIIENEAPKLDADAQWIQMAVCYMGMVGELPRLITKATIGAMLKNDNKDYRQLFPKLERLTKTIRVTFLSLNNDETTYSEWQFEFDLNGWLKYVSREKLSKSDLLKKLEG